MPTVNIKAFSHKKSTVIENGGPKLPTAAQLELGEIAINFAKGYETLSIKNNNNEIVTFTNDNYWINKELAIAAALNDLNDRKQDALEMDEIPTEGSENVVTSGGLYSYITEIEQVTAAALNDLNDRITSLALSDDYAAAAQGTPPLAGDTYETAISKLHKVILDDELITSSALNDLNDRIDNLSLSEDYEAADPTSEPAGGDTYEEAISKLHGAILENELATAGALNDLNTRISDIVIPELILSEDYEPSSLSNEDLFLEPGDSYETAFAKLEKTINDNENITSAALTDLDSRLNLLHLPQSLDDIPDGSTRRLSDYATITSVNSSLATKQDTLVSGTNIKTINNESILGSGNITIQGGGGDTNVIETIKVNNVALTPDANKAVNIPITNEKYGNGFALQTDNGSTQNITASLTDYVLTNNGRVSVVLTHDLPYGATLNINNTGAKTIRDAAGQSLTDFHKRAFAGDIITVVYDGTNYRLVDAFPATEYSSYIYADPIILTLTDDSDEENIKLCTFTRNSGHPVESSFDPLDMILYEDLIFTNPQHFEMTPGIEMWTFSTVTESPEGNKAILYLRIFHQWDPTYQGGVERTYIDTNYSPGIMEVVDLGGPIKDISEDISNVEQAGDSVHEYVHDLFEGYYINWDTMSFPVSGLFYKDSSGLLISIPSGQLYSFNEDTEEYDFDNPSTIYTHPIYIGLKSYEEYDSEDLELENPNYELPTDLLNLDFVMYPGVFDFDVPIWIPHTIGETSSAPVIGVIEDYWSGMSISDTKINDICLVKVKTLARTENFMMLYDYLVLVTEILLGANKERTITTWWRSTGETNTFDFRNVAWTDRSSGGGSVTNQIYYGTSSTAAATAQKEVSIPEITSLNAGQVIIVKPTVTSTVASSTIHLNSFTAYPMRYNNAAITTSTDSIVWSANIPSIFVFDGTYWQFVGHGLDSNTTYSTITQAEIDAGSSTSSRLMTPKLLRDNFYTETEVNNLIGAITPGDINVIESIKVNNTALTPDANKAVNITVPTKVSDLTNDSGFITSYTETDPTVPAWAKAANKPSYTAQEVGALPNTYTPPVTSVNGQTGAVNLTIPSAPGTLNTTATTAQSTSSSEALSGNITLHKVAKTGTYSDLIGTPTIPTVNNATLTIQKNGTTVNTFTANASSNVTANIEVNELPTVSSSDNGKVLQVVSGAWSLVIPTAIYSGTSTPSNSVGNDGDLYLQTS